MKIFIRYKIKKIRVVMSIMTIFSTLIAAVLIVGALTENMAAGSTYFINAIDNARGSMDFFLMVCAFILGIKSMDGFNDSAEKNLPFKTKSRFLVSYILGVLCILTQYLIVAGAAVYHYIQNHYYYAESNLVVSNYKEIMEYDSFTNGIVFITNLFVILLVIYTISLVSMAISRYNIVAVGISVVFCILPNYGINTICRILKHCLSLDFNYKGLLKYFYIFYSYTTSSSYYNNINYFNNVVITYANINFARQCLILMAAVVFIVLCGYIVIKKCDGSFHKQRHPLQYKFK